MGYHKNLIVIVGPSGAGKTTIGNYMKMRLDIPEIISHTTRPMRKGEIQHQTYHFVTKKEFDKCKKVEQTEYAGNFYCISQDEIIKKLNQSDVIFVVADIHGYEQIKVFCDIYNKENKKMNIKCYMMFVSCTPKNTILRMMRRGDGEENIQKRIYKSIKDEEFDNDKYADVVIDNNGDFNNDTIKHVCYFIMDICPEKIPVILSRRCGTHDIVKAYIMKTFAAPLKDANLFCYQADALCEKEIAMLIDRYYHDD